jgi:hypothetical protein
MVQGVGGIGSCRESSGMIRSFLRWLQDFSLVEWDR